MRTHVCVVLLSLQCASCPRRPLMIVLRLGFFLFLLFFWRRVSNAFFELIDLRVDIHNCPIDLRLQLVPIGIGERASASAG